MIPIICGKSKSKKTHGFVKMVCLVRGMGLVYHSRSRNFHVHSYIPCSQVWAACGVALMSSTESSWKFSVWWPLKWSPSCRHEVPGEATQRKTSSLYELVMFEGRWLVVLVDSIHFRHFSCCLLACWGMMMGVHARTWLNFDIESHRSVHFSISCSIPASPTFRAFRARLGLRLAFAVFPNLSWVRFWVGTWVLFCRLNP